LLHLVDLTFIYSVVLSL